MGQSKSTSTEVKPKINLNCTFYICLEIGVQDFPNI